jgi:hypothetical protein
LPPLLLPPLLLLPLLREPPLLRDPPPDERDDEPPPLRGETEERPEPLERDPLAEGLREEDPERPPEEVEGILRGDDPLERVELGRDPPDREGTARSEEDGRLVGARRVEVGVLPALRSRLASWRRRWRRSREVVVPRSPRPVVRAGTRVEGDPERRSVFGGTPRLGEVRRGGAVRFGAVVPDLTGASAKIWGRRPVDRRSEDTGRLSIERPERPSPDPLRTMEDDVPARPASR